MSHRILVIEDQPDTCKLIRMTLQFGDFEVHEARDGETGLALARSLQPTLVLLGAMVSGVLDAHQVCARIKQDAALQQTHVVILAAQGLPSGAPPVGETADAYLGRPWSPLSLIECVESMVGASAAP